MDVVVHVDLDASLNLHANLNFHGNPNGVNLEKTITEEQHARSMALLEAR